MNELIGLIVSRTGLPEQQAKAVVEITVGFIKKKLPAPVAGQVDALLSGQATSQDLGKSIGSLFGKK